MIKQIKPLIFSLFFITGMAHAEQLPRVVGDDARVQIFDYNPDTVYKVKTKLG